MRNGAAAYGTAQLIDTMTGKQVWAEVYDRETDILAVQDEVTEFGGNPRFELAASKEFFLPQNRPGTDIGTTFESPLMAKNGL